MRAMSAAALILLVSPAFGWDRHGSVSGSALASMSALDAQAPYETLAEFLAATGRPAPDAFLRSLKVNPQTEFPPRAGESAGASVALRAVLAAYADEPDWGLDQALFDHYPELWKEEYRYMGGRSGPQTRIFRHMHWPRGFYRPPVPPARLPVLDPTPLGEAHERCALFFGLAREAFASGHPYWGARFLAWSLHYLQDLGQPFHTVQLPSMQFLRPTADGTSIDIEKTTRFIAYFHLATDAYPTRAGGALQARVDAALGGSGAAAFPGAKELARAAAARSAAAAKALGEAAMDFFPEPDDAVLADPLGRVYSDAFWVDVRRDAAAYPQASEPFLAAVDAGLGDTAARSRALVREALKPAAPKPTLVIRALELSWPAF